MEKGAQAAQRHRQGLGYPLRFRLEQNEGGSNRAVADAVPIVIALIPPQRAGMGQVRMENAPFHFGSHSAADLPIELIAQKRQGFGQHERRFRRKQVNGRVLMRRKHPVCLLADVPDQVLQGGLPFRFPQEHAQGGTGQHGALGEIGVLIASPITRVCEQAVRSVFGLRDFGNPRH